MQKLIIEFRSNDTTNIIELAFFSSTPLEHRNTLNYLDKLPNLKYTLIDAESIRATITLDDYNKAITILKQLELDGWVFE